MKRILILAAAMTLCTAAAVQAAYTTEEILCGVGIGMARDEVRAKIGEPDINAGNGFKEIYHLRDGRNAVLIYEWNYIRAGFIVE